MKSISQFDTTDSAKLGRQLSQLEQNVEDEANAIRASFVPEPNGRSYRATASLNAFSAPLEQQTTIDTSLAPGTAILPILAAKNFGRRGVLLFPSSAHGSFVTCQNLNDKINGNPAGSIAVSQGITEVFCDASGYWLK